MNIDVLTGLVQGQNRNQEYIATQSPLAATVKDFWWMVWEQKIHVVICLQDNKQVFYYNRALQYITVFFYFIR